MPARQHINNMIIRTYLDTFSKYMQRKEPTLLDHAYVWKIKVETAWLLGTQHHSDGRMQRIKVNASICERKKSCNFWQKPTYHSKEYDFAFGAKKS